MRLAFVCSLFDVFSHPYTSAVGRLSICDFGVYSTHAFWSSEEVEFGQIAAVVVTEHYEHQVCMCCVCVCACVRAAKFLLLLAVSPLVADDSQCCL